MRKTLIALVVAAGFTGIPALQAQHAMADSGAGHHMAMMMQHHSVATVDLLVSYRDSLKLTDDQLKKLADLREQFGQAGGHAMHGSAMAAGMMKHAMKQRAHISFDRVPGKMVPRVDRSPAEHCPMCPFAILTQSQRERAHQLLESNRGHQHQG